ncbi:MAG TPA: tetratricopeptide repeat protein, partial [bacterium]|nr:tetratricopeptide repeat protein [bacterium]
MKRLTILAVALCAAACHTASAPAETAKAVASATPAKPAAQEFAITGNPQSLDLMKQGLGFFENANAAASKPVFEQAVKADPNNVAAAFFAAFNTPGIEGNKAFSALAPKIAALPDAERLWLQSYDAMRSGDTANTVETAKKLVAAAPNSPRAHSLLGFVFGNNDKPADAAVELQKAIDLDPSYAPPHNFLGYADQKLGKLDDAISQLKTYADLLPKEANPQDSLGEVLMLAGRLDEADAAFQKAIALDPKFAVAWQGSGYARFYKGDVAGGLEAFSKSVTTESDPQEKIAAERALAVLQLAAGKPSDAMKTIATVEKDPAFKNSRGAPTLPVLTAMIQVETGKPADAVKTLAPVAAAIEKSDAPAEARIGQNFHRLMVLVSAQARLGKKDDAAKTLAAMDVIAKVHPGDATFTDGIAYANGEVAVAKKDLKAAAAAFTACSEPNDWCHYELM